MGTDRTLPAVVILLALAPVGRGQDNPRPPDTFSGAGVLPGEGRKPQGAIARLGSARMPHGDRIKCLAFTPRGDVLASAGEKNARFWRVGTGEQLFALEDLTGEIESIAFSPDGRRLAVGSSPRHSRADELIIRDTTSKSAPVWISLPADAFRVCAFSPDGDTVAVGLGDGTIRLFDARTGGERKRLTGQRGAIRLVAYCPDGKTLFSCSHASVCRWDLASGRQLQKFADRGEAIYDAALSADGRVFAVGRLRDVVEVWDTATPSLVRSINLEIVQPDCIALSPDGRLLASGDSCDRAVLLWDLQTGKVAHRLEGHGTCHRVAAFSPDGRTLATVSVGTVRLWDPATGRELYPSESHHGAVTSLAYSPDGRTLASAGDNSVFLWRPPQREPVKKLAFTKETVSSVAFAPDGRTVAAWDYHELPRFWDTSSGELKHRMPQPSNYRAGRITLSPDLKLAATWKRTDSQFDGFVHLWETATAKELRSLRTDVAAGKFDSGGSVVFSPDGRSLLSTGSDGSQTVSVWEVGTGKLRAEMNLELASPWNAGMALSPDGRVLAVVSHDGNLELLDMAARRKSILISSRGGKVAALAFSPSGHTLASAGEDGKVRLWEVATGGERDCFAGHRGEVTSLAFSPGSGELASGGADTTIVIWDTSQPAAGGSQGGPLADGESTKLWADLAHGDVAVAYRAVCRLATSPAASLPLLKRRLDPGGRMPPRVDKLVADLDDPQFAVRERASAALKALAEAAEPCLRLTLAGSPSPEQRRRASDLLTELDDAKPTPDRLRAVRAVEVLERIGSAQAREVLRAASKGSPVPYVMHAASAALEQRKAPGVP
jgi:WD40 repeat protein